ncbi:MAG TPA: PorV/PorQ family protein [Candidatus Dormibacteraeota bacterium]|nr:PorV/PorQ family protein [Candidatus Dormibacteraeota bacterium]
MSRFVAGCLGLLCILGAYAGTAHAQAEAGAQSLLIAPGARSDGMGRAFVAVANDANAIWWNPGALAFTTGHDVSTMYTKLVPDLANDVFFSYTSYAQHVEGWGGIGFSLGYLSYGKSMATDQDGNDLGEFTSYELAPTLAYGTELMKGMGLGVALKLVRVDLAPGDLTQDQRPGRGTTFAADLGMLYKLPQWKSSLGLVLQNLGPNIAYIDQDQSDPLGRNAKLGAAVTPFETEMYRVLVTADVNKSLLKDGAWIEDVGGEFEFNRLLAVRAGYIYDPRGTIRDMTYGLGLNYHGIRIDYASVPQSEFLARVNRFSASYHF